MRKWLPSGNYKVASGASDRAAVPWVCCVPLHVDCSTPPPCRPPPRTYGGKSNEKTRLLPLLFVHPVFRPALPQAPTPRGRSRPSLHLGLGETDTQSIYRQELTQNYSGPVLLLFPIVGSSPLSRGGKPSLIGGMVMMTPLPLYR
eukprot:scaffold18321_cov138-Isochrysis_galbana.AAC.2